MLEQLLPRDNGTAYNGDGGEHMNGGFGARMRRQRRLKELTQEDVAKALGIKRSAVSRYETGSREPDLGTVRALAAILDTSVAYLVGEPGEHAASGGVIMEDDDLPAKLEELARRLRRMKEGDGEGDSI